MSKRPPGELEGQQGKLPRLDGANGLPQVGGGLGYHQSTVRWCFARWLATVAYLVSVMPLCIFM
jgi:hypothetical protein